MSNFQISGKLFSATAIEQKSESFKFKKFTLELTETTPTGTAYTNYVEFQLTNDKCNLIDAFGQGHPVTVHFNLRGTLWNDKTITNLQAWKVEAAQIQQPVQQFQQPAMQQPQQQFVPQQPAQFQPQVPQPQFAPQQQPQQPAPQQWPPQQQPVQTQPQWVNPQQQQQPQPAPAFGTPVQQTTSFTPPVNNGSTPF